MTHELAVRSTMLAYRSALFTLPVVILALALGVLACNTPGITMPPTITAVVFPTATASPRPANTSPPPVSSATSAPPTLAATTPVAPTPTPTETATVAAKTKERTNIRSGPGTDYDILGSLAPGLSARITGRNADKSWWQIEFPASPGGHAWMLASNVDIGTGTGVDALPIASAPPKPTRPPAPKQTATPVPGLIPILRADRSQLNVGECTTLRWDVENVKSVFLNQGSGEVPVVGHDTSQICPDATTVYTLRVVNNNDSAQQYTFTVTVNENCGNTPIISRFEASALEIKKGEYVTLIWDVACAQAVFLKEGKGEREPVTGHDSVDVRPSEKTLYRLIVVSKDGSEVKRDITINIVP